MPLTPEQRDIVQTVGKPLLVLAGPGTGKTEVLAQRILFLIKNNLATKEEIVGITFTTKAANQMKDRLKQLGLSEDEHPLICTLHSFAAKILRENEEVAGLPTEFMIADSYEAFLTLQDAIEDVYSHLRKDSKRIFEQIFLFKAQNKKPEDLSTKSILRKIYQRYQELLRFYKALDFEDLIIEVCSLLEQHQEIREFYQNKCKNLLVDEFQDINPSEYDLIKFLAGRGDGLFVLGDDDQSIYTFRGGTPKIILGFTKDFKNAEEKVMTTCFRCPDKIILGALALIRKNKNRRDKELKPVNKNADPIKILDCKSDVQEARWIAEWIKESVEEKEYEPKDIAILYRGGDIADKIVEEVSKFNIPLIRPSPEETRHQREFIAYLRLIADRRDSLALRVCLSSTIAKGIGPATIRKLRNYAENNNCELWDALIITQKENEFKGRKKYLKAFVDLVEKLNKKLSQLPLTEFLVHVAKTLGYEKEPRITEMIKRSKNLPEGSSLSAFLEDLRGIKGEKTAERKESAEDKENAVLFITMHSVKGLERKVVFVIGMEKGEFPKLKGNVEEERRLFYVAMTRAKDKLFLCHARVRKGQSAQGFNQYDPSQFIFEIPKEFRESIRPTT